MVVCCRGSIFDNEILANEHRYILADILVRHSWFAGSCCVDNREISLHISNLTWWNDPPTFLDDYFNYREGR